jgi:hypothetical protein
MTDWFCINCRKVVTVEMGNNDMPEMFQEIFGRFVGGGNVQFSPQGNPICPACQGECFKVNQDSAAETEPKQK